MNNHHKLAIELRRSGNSLATISNKLELPVSTIHRWTKHLNVSPCHPLYKTAGIVHDYFSSRNLQSFPERFVLIGFLAADGCIHHKRSKQKTYPQLCLNIAQKDRTVLERINQELAGGNRHLSPGRRTNSLQFYLPSAEICSDLSRFGIVPRKTSTLEFPKLSFTKMRYFLRGYHYGDGCLYYDQLPSGNRRVVYSFVTNASFGYAMKEWLESHKVVDFCGVYPQKRNPQVVAVRLAGTHAERFEDFIFNDDKMVLLPRKHPQPHKSQG